MKNKNKNFKKNFLAIRQGFTLVELLVVIAIIIIMTAVLLLNFNNSGRAKTDVENAARQIAAQLRLVQNEALNGKKSGSNIACRYYLTYPFSTAQGYQTGYRECSSNGTFDLQPFTLKEAEFMDTTAQYITFTSPIGAVHDNALGTSPIGSSPKKIGIRSTRNGDVCSMVCVYSSGEIRETFDSTTDCTGACP